MLCSELENEEYTKQSKTVEKEMKLLHQDIDFSVSFKVFNMNYSKVKPCSNSIWNLETIDIDGNKNKTKMNREEKKINGNNTKAQGTKDKTTK